MKSFSTYMVIMFMIVFWIFRIIIAMTDAIGIEFMAKPLDVNFEIALLFVTLLCILLVIKRHILGSLIYLISYGFYFGKDVYSTVMQIINGESDILLYSNVFFSFIGIVIPLMVFFELLLEKNTKRNPVDKKTDWFYKNKQFDRKKDDRADKNNYRTL